MKEKGADSICACGRSTALMIFSLGIMRALLQLLAIYKKNWRKIGHCSDVIEELYRIKSTGL
jgi:hypothetical protein